MQDLGAVREHRGAALPEVEPPRIELRERGDQAGSRASFAFGETLDFSNQLAVGKTIMNEERLGHDPGIASQLLQRDDSRYREIINAIAFARVLVEFVRLR
jgi:hypothetical protein